MLNEPMRIEIFGGLRVIHGENIIDRFRTRKAASLLARLALFPHRAHSREELIDLLWPEMDPEAGRVNLRQTLYSLRHALDCKGESVFESDKSSIRLRADSVVTDVADF